MLSVYIISALSHADIDYEIIISYVFMLYLCHLCDGDVCSFSQLL